MENETYRSLFGALSVHLGAPSSHVSGSGVRFKSQLKGKATVYHDNIAPGNQAEVAFDVESMASRLRMTAREFQSFVAQLRASTGRPVESNAQFNWPRVGISTESHVALIDGALHQRFGAIS